MKNRICLAWFCDLDASDQGRKKFRPPVPLCVTPSQEIPAPPRRPKVKKASELRRMFGRR
jgi:hypothetical protein